MVEDVYASSFISIHTPLAGSDAPAKGRTGGEENFNPHSPCGERRASSLSNSPMMVFQSTLPLRGATKVSKPNAIKSLFQSTLPLRGATRHLQLGRERRQISIHTPLAGSDTPPCVLSAAVIDFNPHSPCGERRGLEREYLKCVIFQSTLPLRGATHAPLPTPRASHISIHTPLAGSDGQIQSARQAAGEFQSTLPLRGATRQG